MKLTDGGSRDRHHNLNTQAINSQNQKYTITILHAKPTNTTQTELYSSTETYVTTRNLHLRSEINLGEGSLRVIRGGFHKPTQQFRIHPRTMNNVQGFAREGSQIKIQGGSEKEF